MNIFLEKTMILEKCILCLKKVCNIISHAEKAHKRKGGYSCKNEQCKYKRMFRDLHYTEEKLLFGEETIKRHKEIDKNPYPVPRGDICVVCDKKFSNVQDHGSKAHQPHQAFHCNKLNCKFKKQNGNRKCTAEKTIFGKYTIDKHKEKHPKENSQPKIDPGEKRFQCSLCKQKFTSKTAVKAHLKKHHNNEGNCENNTDHDEKTHDEGNSHVEAEDLDRGK